MKFLILISLILCLLSISTWAMVPLPQHFTYGSVNLAVSAAMPFVSRSSSSILQAALTRLHKQTFPFQSHAPATNYKLNVNVDSDLEDLQFNHDERYNMTIAVDSATIHASTIWGAMHGLQTFAQLVVWNGTTYSIPSVPVSIGDFPRFPWRGLMLDTSRHFIDIPTLKRNIEGMAASKLNVFHWHAIDAESFPLATLSEPDLAKAAYSPTAKYSISEMQDIVSFAKARGIRTVLEMDVPGHAYSWGRAIPGTTVNCPKYAHNINNIPLDPTKESVWNILRNLFGEMARVFPDHFLHSGGDEVVTGCFMDNPEVVAWMHRNGMTTGNQLYSWFEQQLMGIYRTINKKFMVWEDVFNAGINLSQDSMVQVWSNHNSLKAITQKGHQAIVSAGWYLGVQVPDPNRKHGLFFDTWQDFYLNDPILPGMTPDEIARVKGGEACQWGEQVDSFTIEAMVWPRAAATAERLWSAKTVTDLPSMKSRLNQHYCLLNQRGVHSSPIVPGYCPMP